MLVIEHVLDTSSKSFQHLWLQFCWNSHRDINRLTNLPYAIVSFRWVRSETPQVTLDHSIRVEPGALGTSKMCITPIDANVNINIVITSKSGAAHIAFELTTNQLSSAGTKTRLLEFATSSMTSLFNAIRL